MSKNRTLNQVLTKQLTDEISRMKSRLEEGPLTYERNVLEGRIKSYEQTLENLNGPKVS